MIHFDFDSRYQDENVVGTAISRREGVLLSVMFHAFLVTAMVIAPKLPMFQVSPEERERWLTELERRRDDQERRFVFVQPRVDLRALRPPARAELSDENREAQAPKIARIPENELPFSRGNSRERVEAERTEQARGPEDSAPPRPEPENQMTRVVPPADTGLRRPPERPAARAAGSLGEALRNLQRYVENETFNNPQGGTDHPGATIQFDTRGVEFGPWLRRFVAQVRRNWFIPQAAMVLSGHVVLQFNIHRNGAITDIVILQPSSVEAFTTAAYGAIFSSNPTAPLPPEYPLDKALFTVTFYYNEEPPN